MVTQINSKWDFLATITGKEKLMYHKHYFQNFMIEMVNIM